MEYQTLYRRWRPRGFSDFVGQSHVVTTLVNAVAGKKVAHAYLFTGPRGTGKTSIAKILAKALNCENPKGAEPCDQCSNCVRINEGVFLDVLEIDAASNRGIDEIRDLREKVKFAPAEGKYKIYIIDEVHMLTAEAFNALLKTLEEPPEFVVFILATTEVHKIPATILSRCQRFDFKRFTINEIKGRLEQIVTAEKLEASGGGLELIAKHADGGMRDAVSLLEQAIAHSESKLEEADVRAILGLIDQEEIEGITSAIIERDTKKALELLAKVNLSGKDLWQFGRSLVEHFRELLLTALGTEKSDKEAEFNSAELVRIIETLADATADVKRSQQSALPLELALIKLTTATSIRDLETRIAKLEALVRGDAKLVDTKPNPINESVNRNNITKTAVPKEKTEQFTISQPVQPLITDPMKHWEVFLEVIKKKKRTLAALVQEGKPVSFEDEELVVGFPANLKFHLENVKSPNNKELLESILKNICGRELKLKFIPLEEPDSAKKSQAENSDILQRTVALFGGEVRPVSKEEK